MTEERYEEIQCTIAYGIGALVGDLEDTPGAVKNDVQPMLEEMVEEIERLKVALGSSEHAAGINAERGNEFEEAYEAALETIVTLKAALSNIHTTAVKAGSEPAVALGWIEGESKRVLDATREAIE